MARDIREQRAFERDLASYRENSEHLRALNKFLWQVPLIAMTLTGGLWYAVAEGVPVNVRAPLLAFAGFANVGLIIIMIRVRHVFERILEVTRLFNPAATANTDSRCILKKEKVVVVVFCVLMGIASLISFVGAVSGDGMFQSSMVSTEYDKAALKERLRRQHDSR